MIEIDKPKIEIVDLSTQGSRSVGKFVVEPLERGFGATPGQRYAESAALLSARLCDHFRED